MAAHRTSSHLATAICGSLIFAASVARVTAQEPAIQASAILPRDLSPWGMFTSADIIVKGVMVGLVFASFVTWTTWLAKTIELVSTRRRLHAAMTMLGSAKTLADAGQSTLNEPAASFYADAIAELRLSAGAIDKHSLKERVASRLERLEAAFGRRLNRGTGVLATIGATAPFVGLFGTVWGIYHALTAIGIAGQASIDKVAGPVGEALIMTAIGLAVAVPAVLGYNWLIRRNKTAMDRVRSFGADLHAVLLSSRHSPAVA
jgi:biopolymer transport protein ExbB